MIAHYLPNYVGTNHIINAGMYIQLIPKCAKFHANTEETH